jgi:tRNA G18 (ribose-2'-O)-methylase SpoU
VNFRKIALLVGGEGTGLTEEALAAADVAARIPMPGGIDSLNVTVAAGIALSHLA